MVSAARSWLFSWLHVGVGNMGQYQCLSEYSLRLHIRETNILESGNEFYIIQNVYKNRTNVAFQSSCSSSISTKGTDVQLSFKLPPFREI